MATLEDICPDLWLEIIDFLNISETINLSMMCTNIHNVLSDDKVYKLLFQKLIQRGDINPEAFEEIESVSSFRNKLVFLYATNKRRNHTEISIYDPDFKQAKQRLGTMEKIRLSFHSEKFTKYAKVEIKACLKEKPRPLFGTFYVCSYYNVKKTQEHKHNPIVQATYVYDGKEFVSVEKCIKIDWIGKTSPIFWDCAFERKYERFVSNATYPSCLIYADLKPYISEIETNLVTYNLSNRRPSSWKGFISWFVLREKRFYVVGDVFYEEHETLHKHLIKELLLNSYIFRRALKMYDRKHRKVLLWTDVDDIKPNQNEREFVQVLFEQITAYNSLAFSLC